MPLNTAQKDFLDTLIGLEGSVTTTIAESKLINLGTLILYLQYATTKPCHEFLKLLDKIYLSDTQENLELIRQLKMINDICFNNQVKYGIYGTRECLSHWFLSLGAINPKDYEVATCEYIANFIEKLKKTEKEKLIASQLSLAGSADDLIAARIQREINFRNEEAIHATSNTGWRKKLDLPTDQLSNQAPTSITTPTTQPSLATTASFFPPLQTANNSISAAPVSILDVLRSREESGNSVTLQNEYMHKISYQLSSYGLTKAHLRTWIGLSNVYGETERLFCEAHGNALGNLIAIKHLAPTQAVQELIKLDKFQAIALHTYYDNGLRGIHLRRWRDNYPSFTQTHADSVGGLIQAGYTPQEAMEEILGLNDIQLITLQQLFSFGLRGSDLQVLQFPTGEEFSKKHHMALQSLIQDCKLSCSDAINELNGLSAIQAPALQLYSYGIRKEHLQSLDKHNDAAIKALEYLIKTCELNPDAAIKELTNLNYTQAIFLHKTYEYGVRNTHLINSLKVNITPNYFDHYINAFKYYRLDWACSQEEALARASNLTYLEAKKISEDFKEHNYISYRP